LRKYGGTITHTDAAYTCILALLNYLRTFLPVCAVVILVDDCEFGSLEALKKFDQ
jgi:hypothetical protein